MESRSLNDRTRARALVALIERLGRIAHLRGFHANLNPAQWAALRFLARANPSARTTTGFARANGTTQGTATQTISALVRKGLVARSPDSDDRRVMRLDLTDRGLALLQEDPLDEFVLAVDAIPPERSRALAVELAELNRRLPARAESRKAKRA
ncbi:MAG TPA: MarR family transcriptional regulator [Alphaproteobacteria bacterium]|nr:MarR family transcriptional regulator [Alphaproteobacteria bacterium]